MPKVSLTSPAQVLAEQIKELEAAIADVERQYLEQNQENASMTEAIKIFSSGVAAYVPVGHVQMVDIINNLLDEAGNTQDRQFRWDTCQRALLVGQEASSSLQASLIQLRQQLAIATDELDWQNYEPHAERYRSGFKLPSQADIKEQKVQALQADIASREMHLQRAQAWLSKREDDRPYYAGDALREVTYLAQAIPVLNQQLERLRVEPVGEDPEYQAKFRSYVKGRVAVQRVLEQFLEAQAQYLLALEQFKQAIANHPEAAEFSFAVLSEPRIVSGDGAIRLV